MHAFVIAIEFRRNMEILKVMVTVASENIILDAVTEESIPLVHPVYKRLFEYVDWEKWKEDYLISYQKWLYDDDEEIYDLKKPLNYTMIDAICKVNLLNNNYRLFYWFDINRDTNPNYEWTTCPLSHHPLISLGEDFHKNNRKTSSKFPLILPDLSPYKDARNVR
jgi:hypothetical protein